jgi:hypothetical protein
MLACNYALGSCGSPNYKARSDAIVLTKFNMGSGGPAKWVWHFMAISVAAPD